MDPENERMIADVRPDLPFDFGRFLDLFRPYCDGRPGGLTHYWLGGADRAAFERHFGPTNIIAPPKRIEFRMAERSEFEELLGDHWGLATHDQGYLFCICFRRRLPPFNGQRIRGHHSVACLGSSNTLHGADAPMSLTLTAGPDSTYGLVLVRSDYVRNRPDEFLYLLMRELPLE